MTPTRLLTLTAAILLVSTVVRGDDPKPAEKTDSSKRSTTTPTSSDKITLTAHIGDLAGEVVKVDKGTITLKVPEVVQTGVTHRRVSGHSVSVPKYGTKQVEVSYPLGEAVTVKSVGGKEASLDDVKAGTAVIVHVNKVREGKVGEKLESHVEVKKIEVPNAVVNSSKK